jgi:pyruvate formate lyase activating enzyme
MDKRQFIKHSMIGLSGLIASLKTGNLFGNEPKNIKTMENKKEALFYISTARGIKCQLCPNECNIKPNAKGECRTRKVIGDKLYTIAYGNPCSMNVDPIEKKPLLHFLPSTKAFSIATAGCTFACLNCQNWEISQVSPEETTNFKLMPDEVVAKAIENGCKSIAYTYSEPVSFYEYVLDVAKLAKAKGIKNVFISNGFINQEPLRNLAKYLDAANINLKSFDNNVYVKLNGGTLQPVLDTLKTLIEEKVWLEVTNLIVPTWTDNLEVIRKMCKWLYTNGFKDYPMHFNRFHPMYKLLNLPATPVSTLESAKKIATDEGMNYVYIGNVPGNGGEDTYCPKCKKLIIDRKGFTTQTFNIVNGACKFCGEKIAGIWK